MPQHYSTVVGKRTTADIRATNIAERKKSHDAYMQGLIKRGEERGKSVPSRATQRLVLTGKKDSSGVSVKHAFDSETGKVKRRGDRSPAPKENLLNRGLHGDSKATRERARFLLFSQLRRESELLQEEQQFWAKYKMEEEFKYKEAVKAQARRHKEKKAAGLIPSKHLLDKRQPTTLPAQDPNLKPTAKAAFGMRKLQNLVGGGKGTLQDKSMYPFKKILK